MFRWSDSSPESKISLGGGLGLLVKGLGMKTDSHPHKIINTPTSYMDVEADTGTLLQIRFLMEGGKKICG